MQERNLPGLLVTHSDGTLVGLLRREDAEAAARLGNLASL
jgi:hypothetical protein